MDNSRRGLLKLFGAGALIAPIIGASASESNAVQLIEAPKIRPVELFQSIPKPVNLEDLASAELLLAMKDGTAHRVRVHNPSAWGTISLRSSHLNIWIGERTSPISEEASIAGDFTLFPISHPGIVNGKVSL